jgi:diguanylate cyclase (GGDEF)-like protein
MNDALTLLPPATLLPAAGTTRWHERMLERTERLCGSGSFEIEMPAGSIRLSAGLIALLGLPEGTPPGTGLEAMTWVPADERGYVTGFWRCAAADEPFEFQHRIECADGRRLTVLHRGIVLRGDDGALRGVAMLQDITAQREAERRLQEVATHNEVTGLPNRNAFLDLVDAAAHAARWSSGRFAVFSIDVPRIAEVTASMGFGAGDALAMALAARLRAHCEAGESVAHLGEDEFALLIEHDGGTDTVTLRERAARLRAALDAPVRVGATDIYPRCVVGITRFPDDGEAPAELVERAQTARLAARNGEGVGFFLAAGNAQVVRAMQIESALRRALEAGRFALRFEPQASLHDGRISAVEALLDWQDEELGSVPPAEYLPVAERAGLIGAVGELALRRACAQAAAWRRAGLPPVRVYVNLFAAQLQRPDLAAHVRTLLGEAGAEPSCLGVEISESVAIADMDHAGAVLHELRALGVHVALDGFGTGFSSMASLRRLPIDLVKVDRSFVHDVTRASHDVSITRAIITMAHGLQMHVLVEGVQTDDQVALLAANQCDALQGPWFSPALDADEMTALLAADRRMPERFVNRAHRAHRVLLVDDEENILSALKRLLRRDGYQIVTATSAAEGLQRLAEYEVDVIVSDQRMPGMQGVEFLRRAKDLYPDTVRMVLSGYTELQSIIDAVNEGAIYRFLTKPWDDQHLRAHIAEAVRHKDMADENRRLAREVERANADLASLNLRLSQSVAQQKAQAALMAVNAGSMREVVDELPAAVLCIDADGLVVFVNRAAERLWPQAAVLLGQPAAAQLPWAAVACDGPACALPGPGRADDGAVVLMQPLQQASGLRGLLAMLLPQGGAAEGWA